MSDTVTVPSLMMTTLIVFEESLARDRHTDTDRYTDKDTHIQTTGSSIAKYRLGL